MGSEESPGVCREQKNGQLILSILTLRFDFPDGGFIVRRNKVIWMTALTSIAVLALAAENRARAQQSGAVAATPVGIFESHGDVGSGLHPGTAEFDAAAGSYTMAGRGENMWVGKYPFQF